MKHSKLKFLRRPLSAVLAVVAVTACLIFPGNAVKLTDEEQAKIDSFKLQQEEIDGKIADQEALLDELRGDISRQEEYVSTLNEQLAAYQSQIDILSDKIAELESQIAVIEDDIDVLNGEIDAIQVQIDENIKKQADIEQKIENTVTELKSRLRDVYMNGTATNLEFLFACSDFSSYLSTLQMLGNKADYDDELIAGFYADYEVLEGYIAEQQEMQAAIQLKKDDLQEDIDVLEENKSELAADQDTLLSSQHEIQLIQEEAVLYLEELDRESALFKSAIAAYEQSQADLENQINKVIAEATARENPPRYSGSGFIWPLQYGSDVCISSNFGYRTSPLTGAYSLHGGVDTCCWSGTQGKTVVATAAGTVIYSGWNGYGNCIMIDHGGGIVSLYGHLDSRAVSYGQSVSQGQTIGYAGNTYGPGGYSTGAHLHFEIRSGGSKVNPLNYCSP